jgi:hypothetical protein
MQTSNSLGTKLSLILKGFLLLLHSFNVLEEKTMSAVKIYHQLIKTQLIAHLGNGKCGRWDFAARVKVPGYNGPYVAFSQWRRGNSRAYERISPINSQQCSMTDVGLRPPSQDNSLKGPLRFRSSSNNKKRSYQIWSILTIQAEPCLSTWHWHGWKRPLKVLRMATPSAWTLKYIRDWHWVIQVRKAWNRVMILVNVTKNTSIQLHLYWQVKLTVLELRQ